jgi:DNA-binding IclR family transcriptional regulator
MNTGDVTRVMTFLRRSLSNTAERIAQGLDMELSNVLEILDELEYRGWVERVDMSQTAMINGQLKTTQERTSWKLLYSGWQEFKQNRNDQFLSQE